MAKITLIGLNNFTDGHIFDLLDIPVQDTKLGIYKGENILYSITFDGTKLQKINGYFDLKLS